MNEQQIKDIKKAGEIAKEIKKFIRPKIKKGTSLLEIANLIEDKIRELGGGIGFPTNLCINEIAAHYTPTYNDETKAEGLLSVDFGVEVNGFVADTAFTIDLENSEENKKLIQTSERALENAMKSIKENKTLSEIGESVQKTAEETNLSSVKNLSGHQIEEYDLHAGIAIPNYKNNSEEKLSNGLFAVEPFITTGQGEVYEGKPSSIYQLKSEKNIRDNFSRKVLEYIYETYGTLPFSSRQIVKEFGTRALISLRLLEQQGILHQYGQLIEKSKKPVAQSEDTILITENSKEIISS
jgi:methionyl aminopeptidase